MKRISAALLGLLFVGAGAQAAGKTGFYVGGGFGWSTLETQQTSDMLSAADTCQSVDRGDGSEPQWVSGNPAYPNQFAVWDGAACFDGLQSNIDNLKKTILGVDAFVGWEFIPNWSVELRGVWFGKGETTNEVLSDYVNNSGAPIPPSGGNSGAFKTAPLYDPNKEVSYGQEGEIGGFDLAGRYHWMFNDKWGLSFMLGWAFLKSTYTQTGNSIQANPEMVSDGVGGLTPNLAYRPSASAESKKSDNGYVAGFGAVVNTSESTFLRVEYNQYGVDFDNRFKKPKRIGIDFGFQF